MKCESVGMGSDSVRQLCDSVDTQKNTPETRMFPRLCQFRQGRQGRFQPSLEKKNIGKEGEERRKEKRGCGAATLLTLSKLTVSSIHGGCSPVSSPSNAVATLSDPVENAVNGRKNGINVKRPTPLSVLPNYLHKPMRACSLYFDGAKA